MPEYDSFVTTIDNPYDYFTQFDEWYAYDEQHGYGTCEFVARLCRDSDGYSDEDNDLELERVVDEIVKYNVLGIYRKVTHPKEQIEYVSNH